MQYKCHECGWEGTQLWVIRQQWALMDGKKEVEQKKTRFHTRESLACCPQCEKIALRGDFFPNRISYASISIVREEHALFSKPVFLLRLSQGLSQKGNESTIEFAVGKQGYKDVYQFFLTHHIDHISMNSSLDFPNDYGVTSRQVCAFQKAMERAMEIC